MWRHGLDLFTAHGFDEAEAVEWLAVLDVTGALPDRRHPVEARDYLGAGFTIETARAWWAARFPAAHALRFASAGWSAEQMLQLYRLVLTRPPLNGRLPKSYRQPPRPILDWLATELQPGRVLRLLEAGIGLAEVPWWSDTGDAALDTLAALRCHPTDFAD